MKILVVDDDATCRAVLVGLLSPYGTVETAADGLEAVEAVRRAYETGTPFRLACLDILMPRVDGHAALKWIRDIEAGRRIGGLDGVRILMTTALGDSRNVLTAFHSQCEGYLVKPIDKAKLEEQLRRLGLKPA